MCVFVCTYTNFYGRRLFSSGESLERMPENIPYICMYIYVSKIFPTVADTSGCNSFYRVHYIIIYANTDTLCYLLNICFYQLDTHYPFNLI